METITAVFQDWEIEKNAKGKYVWELVPVTDNLIPIEVIGDIKKILYYRESHFNNPSHRFLDLYKENGERAKGVWQHGRYGSKRHVESISIGKESMKLQVVESYASGQIKDQMKYLQSINVD